MEMQNHNNVVQLRSPDIQSCADCGHASARLSYKDEQFPYGEGDAQILLTARVPVWSCDACGAEYTDGAAEEIRHAEVCRHLGRLSPKEVLGVREQYRLSQQAWSERTGFGIASVKRWETGSLIQNDAADKYMRLLVHPEIFAKVIRMNEQHSSPAGAFRFQTEITTDAFEKAEVFVLRKSYGRS